MTRPTVAYERLADDDGDGDEPGSSRLVAAAPWIAVLALVAAVAGIALGFLNRGTDLSACRSAAWAAIPDAHDLPTSWTLGSTDLNANGLTVSVLGPASADGTTQQPVTYASVTCYGDVAARAMQQNRDAARAAGSTVVDRVAGGDAYDVVSKSTGSVTTLFRVGGLIGQVADAGTSDSTDLAKITTAVAIAMGDQTAAGNAGPRPSVAPAASQDVGSPGQGCGLASTDPGAGPVAPELEATLPTAVGGATLTTESASADSVFGTDPNGRALAARIRALGANLSDLQLAQACDQSGQLDLSIAAFRLPGKDVAKLRDAIVETWLSAKVAGVKQTEVTLGGKKLIKLDDGDGGPLDYVYTGTDYVTVIDTSDAAIATEAATKIK